MNAIKTILASCINGISVLVFAVDTRIDWGFGLTMAVAAIAGGYFGARVGRRLPRFVVRWFVIFIGLTLSAYYFRKQYLSS
jgi:uncharacterized membrane protein YfcA